MVLKQWQKVKEAKVKFKNSIGQLFHLCKTRDKSI
jgi:hypothetical protein